MQEILRDEKKRQKLVIYINPPYAEASSGGTSAGVAENKKNVACSSIAVKYGDKLGSASNELFTQFFMRIYCEIQGCTLASFSKMKYVNSQNFIKFRQNFFGRFLGGFISPADTFDNVRGQFPIGFLIWNTKYKEAIKDLFIDVFNKSNHYLGKKAFYANQDSNNSLNKWWVDYKDERNLCLAYMSSYPADFQNNSNFAILSKPQARYCLKITAENIKEFFIYLAVRRAIEATWINDRDQFYAPNSLWEEDKEFQSDCLAFTLFHGQNRITSTEGTNHFIPFTESEVGAKSAFVSNFMTSFMRGKVKLDTSSDSLFGSEGMSEKLEFSPEAKAVFEAGREIFAYYHAQDFSTKPYNVDASLYDIKEFFQGRNAQGKMNPPSKAEDSHYKTLISTLTDTLNTLAKKLEPKIYEYGFLKE